MEVRPSGERKKLNTWYLVIGIAVAAILAFTILSVFFYDQAMDYRAAKYKAQYVLVEDMLDVIPITVENITDAINDDLDTGWRRSAALTSSALSYHLADSCHAIQVMYKATDEKSLVFTQLSNALYSLSNGAYDAYDQLSTEFGPDVDHDIDDGLSDRLEEASVALDGIAANLILGIDYDRDWTNDPYDLLDGMDLTALWNLALELDSYFP